jgi:hypothetical protein
MAIVIPGGYIGVPGLPSNGWISDFPPELPVPSAIWQSLFPGDILVYPACHHDIRTLIGLVRLRAVAWRSQTPSVAVLWSRRLLVRLSAKGMHGGQVKRTTAVWVLLDQAPLRGMGSFVWARLWVPDRCCDVQMGS